MLLKCLLLFNKDTITVYILTNSGHSVSTQGSRVLTECPPLIGTLTQSFWLYTTAMGPDEQHTFEKTKSNSTLLSCSMVKCSSLIMPYKQINSFTTNDIYIFFCLLRIPVFIF